MPDAQPKPTTPTRRFRGALYDLEGLIKTHLFVLSPNNSGSTLVKNLLARSRHTWNLNKEGQKTFGFKGPEPFAEGVPLIWNAREHWRQRYADTDLYDWETSRRSWYFQAASHSAEATVFVVKSPAFLLLADTLDQHFRNSRFIILARNPYAAAEGILRRESYFTDIRDASPCELAAEHLIRCLRDQQANKQRIGARGLAVRYEDLCADPHGFRRRLENWLPEIDDLDVDHAVAVKGLYDEPIRDMNDDQIARLSRAQIDCMSAVFARHQEVLDSFGYKLL